VAGLLLLAGCGTSQPDAAPGDATSNCPVDAFKSQAARTEVKVWYQLSAKTAETLKKQVDKYNASQNKVTVVAENQGASYEELLAAYQRGIPTKELPDILVGEETTLRYLVDSGTLFPAQDCFDAEKIPTTQFAQPAINHYTVDGKLYPGSASLSDLLTYYNKNHFRKAGLPPDQPPKTLADVRRMAEALKAAGVGEQPVVLKLDAWFIETQLTGEHEAMVDNDNGSGPGKTTKATFDNDTTRELYTWIKDMVEDGLMKPVPATNGQFDHYAAMLAQKSSITIETSTAATSIAAFMRGDQSVGDSIGVNANAYDVNKFDVGAAPVFGVKEAGRAQVGGNAFFMMNSGGDPKISAAWDFLKWWNQAEQQVTWHLEGSYLPFLVSATDDPRVREFWEIEAAGSMLKVAYDELINGIYPDFTGPVIGPMDKTRTSVRSTMDSVAFEGADPATAVAKANAETEAWLTEYNDTMFK
jgi:sn-glycerol 3-phosphate transport system substrate-binding protein